MTDKSDWNITEIKMKVMFRHKSFGPGYVDVTVSGELWSDAAVMKNMIDQRIKDITAAGPALDKLIQLPP